MTTKTEVKPGSIIINGTIYGSIIEGRAGYRFVTQIPGRRGSYKRYATPEECLPKWVKSAIKAAAEEGK